MKWKFSTKNIKNVINIDLMKIIFLNYEFKTRDSGEPVSLTWLE